MADETVRTELPVTEKASSCSCGCADEADAPVLDARAIPHAIRHASIFGALGSIAPGASMILVAPHNPLPLLAQVEEREPGAFELRYLEEGPDAWRVMFTRAP